MQKLTDIISSKEQLNESTQKSVLDILNECLVIESDKKDLTDTNLSIVGLDEAEKQIKSNIQKELIKEKLAFCSQIYNNFRVGQFEYLDTLIESLEKQLSSFEDE